MADERFLFGYLLARRNAKPWRGRQRTRPKMPSALWRPAAVASTALGMVAAWLLFRDSDPVFWRVLAGGVVGFVIGMIVVETMWERAVSRREAASGPIGPRR